MGDMIGSVSGAARWSYAMPALPCRMCTRAAAPKHYGTGAEPCVVPCTRMLPGHSNLVKCDEPSDGVVIVLWRVPGVVVQVSKIMSMPGPAIWMGWCSGSD